MKVFAITADGQYCIGTAIVAAKTEGDAIECAKGIKEKTFFVRWDTPSKVELLAGVSSQAKFPTVIYHQSFGE